MPVGGSSETAVREVIFNKMAMTMAFIADGVLCRGLVPLVGLAAA